jgi:protein disulfide-isomerase A1
LTIDDIVVVAELRGEDEAIFESFYNVAEQYRDRYSFGVRELMSGPSVVRCRNNPDDLERSAKDLERVGALKELIEKCSTPLVLPLTRRNEVAFNEASLRPLPSRLG